MDINIKKKERKYAKRLTIGILEKADIPIEDLNKLKDGVKTTKDISIMRKLANAAIIEGEPFGDGDLFEEIAELKEFLEHFLVKSRSESAKEILKSKRLPKV